MHIAIDARIISSSTGRYVERLISNLEQIDRENRYSILVPEKDRDFWKPQNPNFTVRTIPFDNYSFSEQTGFKKYLDDLAPDLVHFCMPQQPILYRGKKVTTVHDLTLLNTYNSDKNWLVFHTKQLVGRFVFKRIAHTNQHIITPSKFTRDEYQKFSHIADNKISVTYESADPPNGELEEYPLPSKNFITYVGQQSDYKNIKRLGDAHQKLLETHPDLWLVLVGKKNDSAKKNEEYFKNKAYKNIIFTDFIPDSQKNWLMKHASAYVFPSLMEGFGLPPLEAMQVGTPVVSSNATCLPEVLGTAVEYFDPRDTSDMAEKITYVIDTPARQKELVTSGKTQLKKYSWQKMARETHAIYTRVLAED